MTNQANYYLLTFRELQNIVLWIKCGAHVDWNSILAELW